MTHCNSSFYKRNTKNKIDKTARSREKQSFIVWIFKYTYPYNKNYNINIKIFIFHKLLAMFTKIM